MASVKSDDPIAAARSLSSPEAQASFKAALNQVTNSMNSIKSDINNIKTGLPSVQDTGALQVEFGKVVPRYMDVIWKTKDLGTEVSTYAEQLGTALLPIVSAGASKEELVATIDYVRNDAQALGKRASDSVLEMSSVLESLFTFQKNYNAFYSTKGGVQSENISRLTTEISQLTYDADQIAEKIKKVAMEQQSTFLSRNKWMLAIPVLNLIALLADMGFDNMVQQQLDDLKKQYEAVWAQISQKKIELAKLQENAQAIAKYKGLIDTLTDTRMKDVVGGLNILSDVWESADQDARELSEYIASDKTKPVPLCLAIFEQTQGSVYAGISAALKSFATGVTR